MQNQRKKEWLKLWSRIGAKGDSNKAYNDLIVRYAESHRTYHTLTHIEHCLDEFANVRNLLVNPDFVELAIWYHDAIYDTRAKDNEEKSAELVKKALLPNSFEHAVIDLILATKHIAIPADYDARFLTDIDLSILGQDKNDFEEYEHQIRREYGWVADDIFIAGRAAILKSFFERLGIYSTQYFRKKYEARAQQNVAHSLAQLSKRS